MAKILMVDDDEKMLKLFSNILDLQGFTVITASDGKKGFDLAVSQSPDLILLDVMMPSMDGADVFEKLSSDDRTKNIKTAFLTSLVGNGESVTGDDSAGKHEYISKSISKDDFVRKVRDLLIF